MARLTGVQEWAKPEGEVRSLLQAWQNYLRHYSIAATQKTVDLITALGVTGFMYGPVAMAYSQKAKRDKAAQRPGNGATVYPFSVPAGPDLAGAPPPAPEMMQ
jgi:hypothetical protein